MTAAATHARLLVVGDLSVDTYVRVPYFPGVDQKAIGELVGIWGGGMACNFAAAAAACGVSTTLLTCFGTEDEGESLLHSAELTGVDTSPSVGMPGRTFRCLIQVDPSGEKSLVGANTGIKLPTIAAVEAALDQDVDYVYALADDVDWAHEVAALVNARGARLVIDLETSSFASGLAPAVALAARADVVFTNVGALAGAGLGGVPHVSAALADTNPAALVVTNGERGAVALADGAALRATPNPVRAVDTTGAGDAHNGTFLGQLMTGAPIPQALLAAGAVAADCIRHFGARTYVSQRHERDVRTDEIHLTATNFADEMMECQ